MEIHIVHFKKDYGTAENAQNYNDGLCVVGFFGEVIDIEIKIFFFFLSLTLSL